MTEKSQEPRVAPKRVKLARPFIKRLRQDPPAEPETWWDTILPGFGATAYPSGRIVYPVRYFPGGGGRGRKQRQLKLPGTLPPDKARRQARLIQNDAIKGHDPLRERREAKANAAKTGDATLYESVVK